VTSCNIFSFCCDISPLANINTLQWSHLRNVLKVLEA